MHPEREARTTHLDRLHIFRIGNDNMEDAELLYQNPIPFSKTLSRTTAQTKFDHTLICKKRKVWSPLSSTYSVEVRVTDSSRQNLHFNIHQRFGMAFLALESCQVPSLLVSKYQHFDPAAMRPHPCSSSSYFFHLFKDPSE